MFGELSYMPLDIQNLIRKNCTRCTFKTQLRSNYFKMDD